MLITKLFCGLNETMHVECLAIERCITVPNKYFLMYFRVCTLFLRQTDTSLPFETGVACSFIFGLEFEFRSSENPPLSLIPSPKLSHDNRSGRAPATVLAIQVIANFS